MGREMPVYNPEMSEEEQPQEKPSTDTESDIGKPRMKRKTGGNKRGAEARGVLEEGAAGEFLKQHEAQEKVAGMKEAEQVISGESSETSEFLRQEKARQELEQIAEVKKKLTAAGTETSEFLRQEEARQKTESGAEARKKLGRKGSETKKFLEEEEMIAEVDKALETSEALRPAAEKEKPKRNGKREKAGAAGKIRKQEEKLIEVTPDQIIEERTSKEEADFARAIASATTPGELKAVILGREEIVDGLGNKLSAKVVANRVDALVMLDRQKPTDWDSDRAASAIDWFPPDLREKMRELLKAEQKKVVAREALHKKDSETSKFLRDEEARQMEENFFAQGDTLAEREKARIARENAEDIEPQPLPVKKEPRQVVEKEAEEPKRSEVGMTEGVRQAMERQAELVNEAIRLGAEEKELDKKRTALEMALENINWLVKNLFFRADLAKLQDMETAHLKILTDLEKALDRAEEVGYSSERTENRNPSKTPGFPAEAHARLVSLRKQLREAKNALRPRGGQIGIDNTPRNF